MGYRVYLIHWDQGESEARADDLTRGGYSVEAGSPNGRIFLAELAANTPDAVIIDLSKLPSQGRDLGVLIRRQAATRGIPLLFVGGTIDKVQRVQNVLPDAVYTTWEEIFSDLAEAIANPVKEPVVPDSAFAAYAGKHLVEKLGIKPGMAVGLVNSPEDFSGTLGRLPPGVKLTGDAKADCDLLIWFVRSQAVQHAQLAGIISLLADIPLWIAWPKKASGVQSDLSQQVVRDVGLASGLVDYKVCSIDATWSGLLFRRRK